jgi:hypothetical protein
MQSEIREEVFLNLPFDRRYERLFVAQIAALFSLGLVPRSVLEVAECGQGRFARLIQVIRECRASVHDLSRHSRPSRFNMPFELGIACAVSEIDGPHDFFLLESTSHRLDRALSDIKGHDPYIHNDTVTGMISCMVDAFGERGRSVTIASIKRVDRKLWAFACEKKRERKSETLFTRMMFKEICLEAADLVQVELLVPGGL